MYQFFFLFVVGVFIISSPTKGFGQAFNRIQADITIKERLPDSSYQLLIGQVYYDKSTNNLLYNITFPKKQKWLFQDTTFYVIQDKKVKVQKKYPQINRLSIFALALNGQLQNYGLNKNKAFTISNIERKEGKVYITWQPPKKYRKNIGNIIMEQNRNKLTGIVFLNSEDQVIHKQFFENYTTIQGVNFPQRMVRINKISDTTQTSTDSTLVPRKTHYKIITFDNIKVNEDEPDKMYNYTLPARP